MVWLVGGAEMSCGCMVRLNDGGMIGEVCGIVGAVEDW